MYALITVRAASTRLPGKCFLDLAGQPVLRHVIERCRAFGLTPVVSTTLDDDEIKSLCQVWRVPCYQGSAKDKLLRWLNTCQHYHINSFVTVDCDDPLFDNELTRSALFLVTRHEPTVIVGNQQPIQPVCDVCKPDLKAYLGSMGWGMNMEALEHICRLKTSDDTEMIWKHFPPDGLRMLEYDAKPDWIEQRIRLTLDYEEDYWLIKTVVRELGPLARRQQIVNFFRDNPGLTTVNLFRNAEWKQKQNA